MIRIAHPRPELGRQSAFGVEFRDGVATVEGLHPEREAALRLHGFTLEPVFAIVELPDGTILGDGTEIVDLPVVDLESLSRRELREIADREGLDVPSNANRSVLIDAISRIPAEPIADANGTQLPAHAVTGIWSGDYTEPEKLGD